MVWQQLLTEIRRSLISLDTTEMQKKEFAACVVDYEQALVNTKDDGWQRDILSRFGAKLGNAMKEVHTSIIKASGGAMAWSTSRLRSGVRRATVLREVFSFLFFFSLFYVRFFFHLFFLFHSGDLS